MAINTPQLLIRQRYETTPSAITDNLRAVIVGGNAILHRYAVAAERAGINVGAYDRLHDVPVSWPSKAAGSKVDTGSVKVFVKNALLKYLDDIIGDTSSGRGTVRPVSGHTNRVRSSTLSFATNGSYPRAALLHDRDVKVGDRVYIRGVYDPTDTCEEIELWSYVDGLVADSVNGEILSAAADSANQASTQKPSAAAATQIAGDDNCVILTPDASLYDGLADGDVEEVYTVEVVQSSVNGCSAARLRVISASGHDDDDEVQVTLGEPVAIGSRGLYGTFTAPNAGGCVAAAATAGISATDLLIGQKWRITVAQAFEHPGVEASGTYTGAQDDTYVIEVTKGGRWADLPEISVTTVRGLDRSGPHVITAANTAIPIGTYDVELAFVDQFGSDSSAASAAADEFGGNSTVAGLRKGDKYYVTVAAPLDAQLRTIVLRHDLPAKLRSVTDLDLRLFIETDIELSGPRLSSPPLTNWEIDTDETQVILNAGATAYDSSWTSSGRELPLELWGGTVFVQYREWVTDKTATYNFIGTADLDEIPGPTHPDNPLKYGVMSAQLSSNSALVGYIAVADPDNLDSWQAALDFLDSKRTFYNVIPMSENSDVKKLCQAYVNSESAEDVANFKALVVSLRVADTRMVVGESTAADQEVQPTSTDGDIVLGVLEDNPNAAGTQYTLLRVPAGNAGFKTYGVRAGDKVRFLFSVDAFGQPTYKEFTVDAVISEDSLRLLKGHTTAVSQPQRLEIWRTLSKDELVDAIVAQAQSFADKRVVAIWPDRLTSGANVLPGYFAAAAFGGLRSGAAPHQPLTRAAISGFDGVSRSTGFFTETQLRRLEQGGVLILERDDAGSIVIRHAITTDVSNLKKSEESMRVNMDAISLYLRDIVSPLIGRANNWSGLGELITYQIEKRIELLTQLNSTTELGPQLQPDQTVNKVLQNIVHPILEDKRLITVRVKLPAPFNVADITIIAG